MGAADRFFVLFCFSIITYVMTNQARFVNSGMVQVTNTSLRTVLNFIIRKDKKPSVFETSDS